MAEPKISLTDTEDPGSTPEQKVEEQQPGAPDASSENPETPPTATQPDTNTEEISPRPADPASTSSQTRDTGESQDVRPAKKSKRSKTAQDSKSAVAPSPASADSTPSQPGALEELRDIKPAPKKGKSSKNVQIDTSAVSPRPAGTVTLDVEASEVTRKGPRKSHGLEGHTIDAASSARQEQKQQVEKENEQQRQQPQQSEHTSASSDGPSTTPATSQPDTTTEEVPPRPAGAASTSPQARDSKKLQNVRPTKKGQQTQKSKQDISKRVVSQEQSQKSEPTGSHTDYPITPPATSLPDTTTKDVPPRPADAASTTSQIKDSDGSRDVQPTKKSQKTPKSKEDTSKRAAAPSPAGAASTASRPGAPDQLQNVKPTQKKEKASKTIQGDTSIVSPRPAGTASKPPKPKVSEITQKSSKTSHGLTDEKQQKKEEKQQQQQSQIPDPIGSHTDDPTTPPATSQPDTTTADVPPRPADAASISSQTRDSEGSRDMRPTKKSQKTPKSKEDTSKRAGASSPAGSASTASQPGAPDQLQNVKPTQKREKASKTTQGDTSTVSPRPAGTASKPLKPKVSEVTQKSSETSHSLTEKKQQKKEEKQRRQQSQIPKPTGSHTDDRVTPPAISQPDTTTGDVPPRPADAASTSSQTRDSEGSRDVRPTKKSQKTPKSKEDTSKRAAAPSPAGAASTASQPGAPDQLQNVKPTQKTKKASKTTQGDTLIVSPRPGGTAPKPLKPETIQARRNISEELPGVKIFAIDNTFLELLAASAAASARQTQKQQEREKKQRQQQSQKPEPTGSVADAPITPPVALQPDTATGNVPPRPADAASTSSPTRDSEGSLDVRPTEKSQKTPKSKKDTSKRTGAPSPAGDASTASHPGAPDQLQNVKPTQKTEKGSKTAQGDTSTVSPCPGGIAPKPLKAEASEVTQKTSETSHGLKAYTIMEDVVWRLIAAPAISSAVQKQEQQEKEENQRQQQSQQPKSTDSHADDPTTPPAASQPDTATGNVPPRPVDAASTSSPTRISEGSLDVRPTEKSQKTPKSKKDTSKRTGAPSPAGAASTASHPRAPDQLQNVKPTGKREKSSEASQVGKSPVSPRPENTEPKPLKHEDPEIRRESPETSDTLQAYRTHGAIPRRLAGAHSKPSKPKRGKVPLPLTLPPSTEEEDDDEPLLDISPTYKTIFDIDEFNRFTASVEAAQRESASRQSDTTSDTKGKSPQTSDTLKAAISSRSTGVSLSVSGTKRAKRPELAPQQGEDKERKKKKKKSKADDEEEAVASFAVPRILIPRDSLLPESGIYPGAEIIRAEVDRYRVLYNLEQAAAEERRNTEEKMKSEGRGEGEHEAVAKKPKVTLVIRAWKDLPWDHSSRKIHVVTANDEEHEALCKGKISSSSGSKRAESPKVPPQQAAEGERVQEPEAVPDLSVRRITVPQGISTDFSPNFLIISAAEYDIFLENQVWTPVGPDGARTPEMPNFPAVPRIIMEDDISTNYQAGEFIRIFVDGREALLWRNLTRENYQELQQRAVEIEKKKKKKKKKKNKKEKCETREGKEDEAVEKNETALESAVSSSSKADPAKTLEMSPQPVAEQEEGRGTESGEERATEEYKAIRKDLVSSSSILEHGKTPQVTLQQAAEAEGGRGREGGDEEGVPQLKLLRIILSQGDDGPPSGIYPAVQIVRADVKKYQVLQKSATSSTSAPECEEIIKVPLQRGAETKEECERRRERGEQDVSVPLLVLPLGEDGPPDGIYAAVEIVRDDTEESNVLHKDAVASSSTSEPEKIVEMPFQQTAVQEECEGRVEGEEDVVPYIRIILPQGRSGPPDGIYHAARFARADVEEIEILHSGNLEKRVLYFYLTARTHDNLGEQEAIKRTSERLKVNAAVVRSIVKDYFDPQKWQ